MAEVLRFQLRELTRSARSARVCPLDLGHNRIGSAPDNDIRLESRGVSKNHAEIRCGADNCELEDLGSKNGSRINGRLIRRQVLETGDVITFGTSRWSLEMVPSSDVELALELESIGDTHTAGLRATSKLHETRRGVGGLPYSLLEKLLHRVQQRPLSDLEGALLDLVGHLEATGACLFEWPDHEPTRILAAIGHVGEIPERSALPHLQPLDFAPELATLALADSAILCARCTDSLGERPGKALDGSPDLGLAIFGVAAEEPIDPELLASSLLLLTGSALEELEFPRPGPTFRASPLPLPEGIVPATSGLMVSVYEQLAGIAGDRVPVLILGETGVGKEHLARALHDASDRRERPFVAVNCAAIPAELLEAEMFGIGRGIATGVQARRGKFREADGGTLLLDEIGDMPLPLQAKLLRVLQEGEVTPVGESTMRVDVRLVSASHADLPTAIAERRFRQDLYYRLAGYVLRVPPLRDRPDDLPVLLGHFLRTFGQETGRKVRGVTVKALESLSHHGWPGNVRQLQHVARRLIYLCPPGQAVDSARVREALDATELPTSPHGTENFVLGTTGLDDHLATIESALLRQALERTEGNQSKAARLLRISRNSLARRLNRLKILPDRE